VGGDAKGRNGAGTSCTKGQPRATETLSGPPLSSRDEEGGGKRVDDEPGKAHTRERATHGASVHGGGFKSFTCSREKLAHLISNGSFNNSRPFPRVSAPAMRALTVLYFRDAPDSLRPLDQPGDKNVSCSFRRRLSDVLLPAP
jgi:hypothetical protein